MNKIIYCFWLEDLKKQWKKNETHVEFPGLLKAALNTLFLSVSTVKKWGFEVEIITDVQGAKYVKQLHVDKVRLDLEWMACSEMASVEAKLFVISRQVEPFVYIDWNIVLNSKRIIEAIKNCKQDLLVASQYHIVPDTNYRSDSDIFYGDLLAYSWMVDMSGHFIDEFVQNHEFAYDCRIIGFNDLGLRDAYVENFMKCIEVTNKTKSFINSTIIKEEYLLYCITLSRRATCLQLIAGNKKDKDLQLPDGRCLALSEIFSPRIQNEIKEALLTDFPDCSLINESPPIENKIKISLCTVVMNRKAHLTQTLRHNLETSKKFNGKVDINLLNYNSTDGLEEFLFDQDWFVTAMEEGLLTYYRNYSAKHYHRTLPKNAIHFLARGEYLFNIDADNFVSESYLTYCLGRINSAKNMYLRSSYASHNGAFGRIGIHRDAFREIGGYNLKFENYGFEDSEITLRLRKMGLDQLLIPSHLCLDAIEHENDLRMANEKNTAEDHIGESDNKNRKKGFELYPNNDINMQIELYKINHKKEKERIDDPRTYISHQLV